ADHDADMGDRNRAAVDNGAGERRDRPDDDAVDRAVDRALIADVAAREDRKILDPDAPGDQAGVGDAAHEGRRRVGNDAARSVDRDSDRKSSGESRPGDRAGIDDVAGENRDVGHRDAECPGDRAAVGDVAREGGYAAGGNAGAGPGDDLAGVGDAGRERERETFFAVRDAVRLGVDRPAVGDAARHGRTGGDNDAVAEVAGVAGVRRDRAGV